MKLVIVLFIVASVMLVADHGKADHNIRHGTWKLDEILKEHNYDYRKEIEESVFKPCLQYLLAKRASMDDVFLEGVLEDAARGLRKTEPSIYYEVIKHDSEMREAIYAMVAAQCKKKVDKDW